MNTLKSFSAGFLFVIIGITRIPAQETDPILWEKAMAIHHEAIVLDAHTHPMLAIFSNVDDLELAKNTHKSINFVTMKKGGLDGFFFPLPFRDDFNAESPSRKIKEDIQTIRDHIHKYSHLAEIALTSVDVERIHNAGKRAVLFSIEYTHMFEGDLGSLEMYFNMGVRSITLYHSKRDPIGQSDNEEPVKGLSQFGKQIISEMNRLGMLIDITHLPDVLQKDVLNLSQTPVVASHSCVRALNNISRNIPDDILKAIDKNDGAVMIGFSSMHLSNDYYVKFQSVRQEYMRIKRDFTEKYKSDKEVLPQRLKDHDRNFLPQSVDIEVLINHIDHAVKVAGIDHVGLGSDFIREINPIGLEDPEGYPLITYHLLKRGYSEKNIKKILGGNLLRILKTVQEKAEDNTDFPELNGPYFGQEAPVDKAEVFMDGVISTIQSPEMCGAFSVDGKEFYFNGLYEGHWTIMMMREIDGQWAEPAPLTFTSHYTDRDFTLSPDGNNIYFGSNRPREKNGAALSSLDIYRTRKDENGQWSNPENLGAPINSDLNENYPSVSKKGNLTFFSNRENGLGGCDIYLSRLVNGWYLEPENLGPAINSEKNDWDGFIAPDESYFIFSSQDRDDSIGGQDLYISFRKKNGDGTRAKNMGPKVNSAFCEICPGVSLDGRYLFFTTRRRGKADIFWIHADIINELRPQE